MDKRREAVYLAALLHDIGKFLQRADDNGLASSNLLTEKVKNLESIYCPSVNGRYSHKHAVYTAQFITNGEAIFKEFFGARYPEFFAAAVAHHNPQPGDLLQLIVQKADHYASGLDRTQEKNMQDAVEEKQWSDSKHRRLYSIFEGLLREDVNHQYRMPVMPLSLHADFFPKMKDGLPSAPEVDYTIAWSDFANEFENLQPDSFRAFADTLLALLEKYTANIPSSTVHLPDVSLYDHLRSTAALALCLYDYTVEREHQSVLKIESKEQPLLLVGADISGIQAFIYDIAGSEAAKNLKGRSFYLQLLVDSVLQKILSELELYKANIVYASGGGFYLLVPNTSVIKAKLATLKIQIADKLFSTHQTSLSLAIGYIPISQEQIFKQEINEVWKQLAQELNKDKRQKFKDRIQNNYKFFFEASEEGGIHKRDFITNEEFTTAELETRIGDSRHKGEYYLDEEQQKRVKYTTYQQVLLGKVLKSADYMVLSEGKPIPHWEIEAFEPCGLGNYYYFLNDDMLRSYRGKLRGSADTVQIFALNELNFFKSHLGGDKKTYGFYLYGGNDFPAHKNGNPKTFDELAGDEHTSLKRLGILRMDVDNLGQIFIQGFGDKKRTFSRYSALSRNLDYFFKGYLNIIWESNPVFKENTYILYAGGDDLFIVGKWNVLADFAQAIYKEFKAWTCHNPQMGLSGGMAIVGGKFPIAKGAALSQDEEKNAKSHLYQNTEKNAFSMMGHAMNWDMEYPLVLELKNRLLEQVETNKELPKALLSKISAFAEQARTQKAKGQNESWRWLIAYDFARAKDRVRSSEGKQFLDELKNSVFTDSYNGDKLKSSYSFLELLNLAARWAELEIRS
jgi:CRISPR-associated protein Csm1